MLILAAGDLGWRSARGRDEVLAGWVLRGCARLGVTGALVRTKPDGLNKSASLGRSYRHPWTASRRR